MQVTRCFLIALVILTLPPLFLIAIATASLLHAKGVVPLHHWSPADWIVMPARFVLFCYPLVILGAALLTAGLMSSERTPTMLAMLAFAWGLFCGIVVAWFPDPVTAPFHKGVRGAYAGAFAASSAAWVYVQAQLLERRSLTSGCS
jgi:hypothetical protein